MNKPPIIFSDVSFEYPIAEEQSVRALSGLSFSIKEGEFVGIIGHNGSGKSTLAKLMNGLLTPTKGKVEVFGVDTKDTKAMHKMRSNVGVVFQNPDNQLVASTVEEDVAFGAENLGVPREEIVKRVDEALEAVNMNHERESMPYRLSGGQKQRVAIAGILALYPKVMVFDESTAMLDPSGRKEVMEVAKKLNKSGITVIFITHFMNEALMADRLIVMNDGGIVADDTPENVFSTYPKLREIDLALPAQTQIARTLSDMGLPINPNIMTDDELAEEICRLLQ